MEYVWFHFKTTQVDCEDIPNGLPSALAVHRYLQHPARVFGWSVRGATRVTPPRRLLSSPSDVPLAGLFIRPVVETAHWLIVTIYFSRSTKTQRRTCISDCGRLWWQLIRTFPVESTGSAIFFFLLVRFTYHWNHSSVQQTTLPAVKTRVLFVPL